MNALKIFAAFIVVHAFIYSAEAQYCASDPEYKNWDTTWTSSDTTYKIEVRETYIYKNEIGIIEVNLFRFFQEDSSKMWTYQDSLFCDWQDVVVQLEFGKAIIEDLDSNKVNEIILIYTLDCTTDVSPLRRRLVYYDISSQDTIMLEGWTLDPISPFEVKEEDLIFTSEDEEDSYNPTLIAGKIKLNNFPGYLKWFKRA